ncbi:MAG: thioredoxin family protein, partial [Prevotella sp.]|nr:thioredoxin family protein [Prevotella sp.]
TLPVTSTLIQDKDMLSLTAILVNLNNLGIVNAAQVHLGAGAAGITDVQKDANSNVVERYNLNGMRVNAPQKGLNIVKLADGRCVKVAVK